MPLVAAVWKARRHRLRRTAIVVLLAMARWMQRISLALDHLLFPAFAKVAIQRPLFIVGPPRCGTTLLHRLVASQRDQFTTTPLWELVLAPAIWQKYVVYSLWHCDRWIGGPVAKLVTWVQQICLKSTQHIHATSLSDPEEDYLAMLNYNACFLLVAGFPDCDAVWRLGYFDDAYELETRQRLAAAYRGLLQRHLFFRGTHLRMLSKNPSFCSWTRTLEEEFPDARFLAPIRDPMESVPSQLSAMGLGPEQRQTNEIAQRFAELLAHYYKSVGLGLDRLPPQQRRRIRYTALCRCEASDLIRVLRELGYEALDEDTLVASIEASRQPRARHQYDLKKFGLNASQIGEMFPSSLLCGLQESEEFVMDKDLFMMPSTNVGVTQDA